MNRKKIISVAIALLLSSVVLSACADKPVIYNTGGYQLSEEKLKMGNFNVRYIEMESINGDMVYGANDDYFMADGYIFYRDPYLSRMRPDGVERTVLPEEVKNFPLYEATYNDGFIYFIDNRAIYFDAILPPGTNENLLRMRSDGTELQHCIKDVASFKIVDEWIVYQSGYELFAAKIDDWDNQITLSSEISWNIRSWIIYENYIYFSTKKTNGGEGQYNSKMYRSDLNGTNTVLLEDDASTPFTPLFVYDSYLYYKAYSNGNGDIIKRMSLSGENKQIVIDPQHYVLLDNMRFIDGWLYYLYSWRSKTSPYQTFSSIRKVAPDGTQDQEFSAETDWFSGKPFGEVTVWVTYDGLPASSSAKVTVQQIFSASIRDLNHPKLLYNGEGWVSCQHFYAWNGDLY
ncbi:MAG: DUF5050 domain-containing protein, partial [Clostridia bacterium]|nr:DUF5050 domain-containing protein [Clostridia bacterium]